MGTRTAIAVVVLFALSACAPKFDWRELNSNEGGFSALMPAKPRYEERPLAGPPGVTMHLWSARAAESLFGVGYADYPAVDAHLLDATRDALVANIRGRLLEEKQVAQNGLAGREFRAESGDMALRARLLFSGPRLYQVVVIGRRSALSDAAANIDLFLSSLRPRRSNRIDESYPPERRRENHQQRK